MIITHSIYKACFIFKFQSATFQESQKHNKIMIKNPGLVSPFKPSFDVGTLKTQETLWPFLHHSDPMDELSSSDEMGKKQSSFHLYNRVMLFIRLSQVLLYQMYVSVWYVIIFKPSVWWFINLMNLKSMKEKKHK